MMQLTFDDFVESDDKLLHDFYVHEVDKELKSIIHDLPGMKNIIKNSFTLWLNKSELLEIVNKSIRYKRSIYGFYVWYQEKDKYYELFIRFGNNTSKSLSIYDFIHEYFTEEKRNELN